MPLSGMSLAPLMTEGERRDEPVGSIPTDEAERLNMDRR